MHVGLVLSWLLGLACSCMGQLFPASFLTPPALIAPSQPFVAPVQQLGVSPQRSLAHRAVLFNDEQEALLPSHLKNPFYKNPRIAEALAKESWFGPGERPVTDIRDTEKIPRERIISVLRNAGLARR